MIAPTGGASGKLIQRISIVLQEMLQNYSKQSSNSADDRKSTRRSLSHSLSSQISSKILSYGVDWSDCAQSISHCWLPSSPTNSTCISCTTAPSTFHSSLVICATCSLQMDVTQLSQSQETTSNSSCKIPPCRPSFMDNNTTEGVDVHDLHYWSHVTALLQPCMHCKRIRYDDGERTSINRTVINKVSDGLVCLWCSQNYHQRCWESIKEEKSKNKCDYGTFRDILVQPKWLHRVVNSRFGFRAEIPNDLESSDSSPTPVLVFINKLSGGQKGEEIYRKLLHQLNPRQVFLLEDDATIMQALDIYSSLKNLRICICGGDGTVRWVLSRLVDAFPTLENPPAGICPLGTGNDLSRVLGWGYRYTPKRLQRTLTQISRARPVPLDRWQIQIEPLEINASRRFLSFMNPPKFIRRANQPLYDNHRTPIKPFFFNYISFGLDAAVVLDFHARRTLDASRYTSPLKNKLLYINESRKYFNDFAFGMAWSLSSYVRLICDGEDLTDSLRHYHSLVVLNTRSFGSGTRPWGTATTNKHSSRSVDRPTTTTFEAQDYGDQRIEVLGLNTVQMAFIHLGVRGKRIAQCSELRIELRHPMPVHMDGEPFCPSEPIAVNITHAGQVMVLCNENE